MYASMVDSQTLEALAKLGVLERSINLCIYGSVSFLIHSVRQLQLRQHVST